MKWGREQNPRWADAWPSSIPCLACREQKQNINFFGPLSALRGFAKCAQCTWKSRELCIMRKGVENVDPHLDLESTGSSMEDSFWAKALCTSFPFWGCPPIISLTILPAVVGLNCLLMFSTGSGQQWTCCCEQMLSWGDVGGSSQEHHSK